VSPRPKLSVPADGGFAPHAHSHAFRLEPEAHEPARLVAAPDRDQVGLLIDLARTLPEPFHLVYVLLSMRTLRPPGRYQAARPLSRAQLESFLARFRAFLEQDGRHHLWIGSAAEPSTLVYDHHDLLLLYGRLDAYQAVLRAAGMGEGPVVLPPEHRHEAHDALDAEEQALMGALDWTWNPLEPGDEELD
jgi:hypothetical protein